jgi:molybdate transport system substrate-binding protein
MAPSAFSRRPFPSRRPVAILLALLIPLLVSCSDAPLTVYVPASLQDVMEGIATDYAASTGIEVAVRGSASGVLAREIEAGAPADVVLLADPRWATHLKDEGKLVPESVQILAWNRLVVVVPWEVTILPQSLSFLPTFPRLAIGDPELAPLGAYAKEALETLGYWDQVKDNLIYAPDARSVLALAERAEVEAAIVYATDALHSHRVRVGFEIPERSHDPIVYVAAIPVDAPRPEAARKFLAYLGGAEGRARLRAWGLEGP